MTKVCLIDGDIPVYTTLFTCSEETEWDKVRHTADQVVRKIFGDSKCTHYMGFLTDGQANFRVNRATTWPYKGKRQTNKDKPTWFFEIREYFRTHWKFQVPSGIEADDALTIAAEHFSGLGIPWVIATKDKDLWQYPGEHLNLNTKPYKLFRISKEQAHRNLWKQVIMGDTQTDNIPGLSHAAFYNCSSELVNLRITLSDLDKSAKLKAMRRAQPEFLYGEATVKKLLDLWDPEDYATNIYELYVDAYWDDPEFGESRFYETFDLVYMLRELPDGVEMTFDYHTPPKRPELTLGFDNYEENTDEAFEAY